MYDHNGLRTQKIATVNGSTVTTDYVLHGKLLMHMMQGNNKLHFFYDAQSRPVFVEYNGTKYVYVLNLQGDIVALLDVNGATMVEYKYDAWGKPISTTGTMASTLGKLNPFRYRGHVYDEETGLYYLGERFYDCKMNRFLNADVIAKPWCGIFTYCRNASVKYYDPNGAEERDCCFGNALSIDVYIVDGANSELLSQILTAAYGEDDLDPLNVEVMKAITNVAGGTTRDIIVSSIITNDVSGTLASSLISTVTEVYDVLATRSDRVCRTLANNYAYARSNHMSTYSHTEVVFYYGYYDCRFYMTHYDKQGNVIHKPFSLVIKGFNADLDAMRTIHSAISKLFTPVHHGHPKGLTTYEQYNWRSKFRQCAK